MEIKKSKVVSCTQKRIAKDTILSKSNVYNDLNLNKPINLFYVNFIFDNNEIIELYISENESTCYSTKNISC
jgi:hypothetical protein